MTTIVQTIKKVFSSLWPKIQEEGKMIVESNASNLIASCLKFISCFLDPKIIDLRKPGHLYPEKIVMTYLSFSLIWSVCANLHDSCRKLFNRYFRAEIQSIMPDFPEGDIYDFGIDLGMHRFQHWDE